jgi:hypothetical protein
VPYDLLVIDRDGGAHSRGALGRLIESAGTNVLVLRTQGTDARVRAGRKGKELRMARGGPEALVDVPLFSSLTKRHLRHIAGLSEEEQFAEGTTLAEEGKPGDTFLRPARGRGQGRAERPAHGPAHPGRLLRRDRAHRRRAADGERGHDHAGDHL